MKLLEKESLPFFKLLFLILVNKYAKIKMYMYHAALLIKIITKNNNFCLNKKNHKIMITIKIRKEENKIGLQVVKTYLLTKNEIIT